MLKRDRSGNAKTRRPERYGKARTGATSLSEQATYRLGNPRPAQDSKAQQLTARKSGVLPLDTSSQSTTKKQGSSKHVSRTIVAATPYWYDIEMPALQRNDEAPELSTNAISVKIAHAAELHEAEIEAYTKSDSGATVLGMSASDASFLSRILSSGTLSDRLSALTLMVQSSPLHNTRALDALKSMAGKKSRDESLKAIRAVTDWWVGGGAPSRKLKYIRDQPLNLSGVTDKQLIVWYFEDWLKKYFFTILQLLEALLLDPLPFVRTQAMTLVAQLLKEKPEQEQNLLRLLVNKLGDPERTVASKASYHLLQLLQSHPAMKTVVIREITALILRAPSTSAGAKQGENKHAKYYGVLTFNQTTMSRHEREVARALVDVYFDLFQEILGKDEEPSEKPKEIAPKKTKKDKGKAKDVTPTDVEDENSKMMAAILTGINRALPFAELDQEALNTHVDLLFRITHSATFNISIQALMLVFHVMSENKGIVDRFYRTLYDSLFDPRLLSASKQTMYLNLLIRALNADASTERQMAFVKRIFQALTLHQPAFICGAIYLLGELLAAKPELRVLFRTGSLLEPQSDENGPTNQYDPRKREPLYAHASETRLWEISPYFEHFHPSVSLHASQLTSHQKMKGDADLGLNTVMHFLDRFVYRNPRKPKPKGASAMQPSLSGLDQRSTVRLTKGYSGDTGTVNDPAFWSQKAASIPVDQLFFHKYFAQKSGRHQAKADKVNKRKKEHKDTTSEAVLDEESEGQDGDEQEKDAKSEAASVESPSEQGSEDEEEVWKAMKSSMAVGEIGGSDIDEMDDDMRDISDLSDDSDDDGDGDESEGGEDATGSAAIGIDLDDDEEVPEVDEDEDEDFPTFDEGEDDLVNMDDEVEEPVVSGKRKATSSSGHGMGKRRKLRQLPTFATYEDYRDMIDAAPEENI